MMMRIKFTLLIIFISTFCFSQSIHDKSFKVYTIDDRSIVKIDGDYLFTIAIPKNETSPVVFIQSSRGIPTGLISRIYPNFQTIFVLTPNWKRELPSRGEPTASSVIYEFTRTNPKIKKDSIVMEGFPEREYFNFLHYENQDYKNILKKEEKLIFYKERGTTKTLQNLQKFITKFENNCKCKIGKTYTKHNKNITVQYLTLDNLTSELKLKFLMERSQSNAPQIFTPEIISIE